MKHARLGGAGAVESDAVERLEAEGPGSDVLRLRELAGLGAPPPMELMSRKHRRAYSKIVKREARTAAKPAARAMTPGERRKATKEAERRAKRRFEVAVGLRAVRTPETTTTEGKAEVHAQVPQ
jgi:hypothetical protein